MDGMGVRHGKRQGKKQSESLESDWGNPTPNISKQWNPERVRRAAHSFKAERRERYIHEAC